MALAVQKHGGSSVTDAGAIKHVVKRITETKRYGHNVIVMVSAMEDITGDLLDLMTQVMAHAPERETGMLLSVDERIPMSLLAMAINELGETALSFTEQQTGVHTGDHSGKAAIVLMMPGRTVRSINEGNVAIAASFQGANRHGDIITLGRGGSDTTAVVPAISLQADVCEIYTDTDGLLITDPRTVPTTRCTRIISFKSILEMAAHGVKILHLRAVEFVRRYRVSLHVRSSLSEKDGTWISNTTANPVLQGVVSESALAHYCQEETAEGPAISGIAHDRSQDKLTLMGVPDKPGSAVHIFEIITEAGVSIDAIIQNVSAVQGDITDLAITMPHMDAKAILVALEATQNEIGYAKVVHTGNVGKLSLIGTGMHVNPGVSVKLFGAFSAIGINIDIISTSEIRLSTLMSLDQLDDVVRAVHTAFDLDSSEVETVIYGDTGQ